MGSFPMHTRSAGFHTLSLMLTVTLALQSGCATLPQPPAADVRSELGRVAVVVVPGNTRSEFQAFAKGRLEGTAKGAGGGAATGILMGLGQGGEAGPYMGGAVLIAAAIGTLVGAVVGGIAGERASIPKAVAERVDADIQQALAQMELAAGVARAVSAAAVEAPEGIAYGVIYEGDAVANPRDLAARGYTTALEVRVEEAGFRAGGGENPRALFYMNAAVRLLNTGDGSERYRRSFQYVSVARPFSAWFADHAELLAAEFERAKANLGRRVVEEMFVVTAFPFASGMGALPGSPGYGACWFAPLRPPQRYRGLKEFMLHPQGLDPQRDMLLTDTVDSLQPTLAWEGLPRPRDRTPENADVVSRIDGVSYELRIWEAPRGYPERLVYDRVGLPEPEHRLEYPLHAGTAHFWSFRARYRLAGEPQASRWAFSLIPSAALVSNACDLDEIPAANYYRFRTPGAMQ